MGNGVSTPDCFMLSQLPAEKFDELTAESFTVIRTSGEHQTGWRIPSTSHGCHQGILVNHHAHVWDHTTNGQGEKNWRFHMIWDGRASDLEQHCCGWRHCEPGDRTFWPTRLTTEEEKEAWWTELDTLVGTLKRNRDLSEEEWFLLAAAQKAREEALFPQEELFPLVTGEDAALSEQPDVGHLEPEMAGP